MFECRISFLFVLLFITYSFCEQFLQKEQIDIEELQYIQNEQKQLRELRKRELSESLKSALISKPDSFPLIQMTNDNRCLLTVKEYNKRIENIYNSKWRSYLNTLTDTLKPFININDIQQIIIYSVFEDAYKYEQWELAKMNRLFTDSLRNETTRAVQNIRKETTDSVLKFRYQQYYNELFSQKNNSLYYIMISSDSVLLYKTLLSLCADNQVSNCNPNSEGKISIDTSFDVYSYDSLTYNMQKIADTLQRGRWSIIQPTKWGYYSLRIFKRDIRKEISFDEAIEQLVYLPELNETKIVVSDEDAYEYFIKNEFFFKTRDTLLLTVKITPQIINYRDTTDNRLRSVTLNTKSNECKDIDLPPYIYNELSFSNNDSCVEWLNFFNAQWELCLIQKKKAKTIKFEDCIIRVKQHIIANWKQKTIAIVESTAQSKENNRSYQLFLDKFLKNNSLKDRKNFENEIRAWAERNVKVNQHLFR